VSIGNFEIHWYSAIILFACFVGVTLAIREGLKRNVRKDFMFNMAFWSIIIGILGARLYYVLFNWSLYENNLLEIFKIWNGGLAIHGGIIAGFITIVIYTKKYEVSTFKMMDIGVVSVILGQAIGRWGNFFNMEAYGVATTYEHLKGLNIPEFIINGMEKNGLYYTPTFLYESLWCLAGFIVLLIIRKWKYLKVGQLTSLYFIWYGVGRFIIEGYRLDSLMIGGFRAAQVISIITVTIAVVVFVVLCSKRKFEDLYTEPEREIRF